DQIRGELQEEFMVRAGDDLNSAFASSSLNANLFPGKKDSNNYFEYQKSFKSEVLKRFYKDWYRPDLMALSVVGNIEDLNELENRIKEMFSNLTPPRNPRTLPDRDMAYYNLTPQFAVVQRQNDSCVPDKNIEIQMYFRAPLIKESISSLEGIQRLMLLQLLIETADGRLKEVTKIGR